MNKCAHTYKEERQGLFKCVNCGTFRVVFK